MSNVQLLPTMTLQQMAVWCAVHRQEIRVSWRLHQDTLIPVVDAVPQTPDLSQDQNVQLGMAWWNGMQEHERARWLRMANTDVPAHAWRAFLELQAGM
jgi:hypothetical protein